MTSLSQRTRSQNGREPDIRRLVRRAQRDPRYFGEIYDLYVHRVYRFLYSQGLSAVEADDVAAQTFLDALEALPRYREQGRFAGWLFSIARNRMRDHFRATSRERRLDEFVMEREHTSLPDRIDQQRMVEALGTLIDGLEPAQRELLNLRYAADLTFREIAHVVEGNEEAVKKRLYRLVATLRQQMEIEHA
jgi:RNA polymerase sigma-70 factor (ECF subfamily)